MKKHIVAAAMAVAAGAALVGAPTESQAIPAFARQTGSACLNCHFQTFPAITAFGRAFKQGAFTDVGDEALVEDEGLSIPAVLNATVVVRGNHTITKTSGITAQNLGAYNAANQTAFTAAQLNQINKTVGVWNIPSETPLLIAGRIGEHTGAFLEWVGGVQQGVANINANNTPSANFQVMNSFDFGDLKGGVNIFNAGFGWTQGIEVSNVIGQHAGAAGGLGDVSAEMQLGFRAGNEQGLAFWVGSDLFTAQLAMIAPDAPGANVKFKLVPGFRVFVTPEVAGWDVGVGVGFINGKKTYGNNAASYAIDNQFIDVQAQGEVGDAQIGVYLDYAQSKYHVPNAAVAAANQIVWGNWHPNAGDGDKLKGYSLRVTVKPLHNVIFGLGYGQTKYTPAAAQVNAGVQGATQKITKLDVTYEIYQNFEINLAYTTTKNANWVKGWKQTDTLIEFEALM